MAAVPSRGWSRPRVDLYTSIPRDFHGNTQYLTEPDKKYFLLWNEGGRWCLIGVGKHHRAPTSFKRHRNGATCPAGFTAWRGPSLNSVQPYQNHDPIVRKTTFSLPYFWSLYHKELIVFVRCSSFCTSIIRRSVFGNLRKVSSCFNDRLVRNTKVVCSSYVTISNHSVISTLARSHSVGRSCSDTVNTVIATWGKADLLTCRVFSLNERVDFS